MTAERYPARSGSSIQAALSIRTWQQGARRQPVTRCGLAPRPCWPLLHVHVFVHRAAVTRALDVHIDRDRRGMCERQSQREALPGRQRLL